MLRISRGEHFYKIERLRSERGAFFCVGGILSMPVCAYGKKVKKSCKNGKIFCVEVLKNALGCDIIDKNMRIVTFIGRARDVCAKKGG